jgi:DNA-directed RNA polymerase subunit L
MTPEIRIRIKEKEQVRDLFVQIEERIIGELEKFINDFSEHFKEESTSRRGFHLYKIYKNLAQFG